MKWLRPLDNWPKVAMQALQSCEGIIRVVVADVRGSAPRETGTCMLVTPQEVFGTIGGGNLEHIATQSARAMLSDGNAARVSCERFVLATQLAQCCGGVVDVWFERMTAEDSAVLRTLQDAIQKGNSSLQVSYANGRVQRVIVDRSLAPRLIRQGNALMWQEPLLDSRARVWVFGAGHVGQALVRTLVDLPVAITWIDSRGEYLPDALEHVCVRRASDPVAELAKASPGTHFIVMTPDHALDYALCRTILERDDAASVGVIGSQSKAARFRSRLAHDGVLPETIATLCCPIGIEGIRSKVPAVIAIAVAAQLMRALDLTAQRRASTLHPCPAADANGNCTHCTVSRVAS
jgi:xanthine dehydrogenase accessory factor